MVTLRRTMKSQCGIRTLHTLLEGCPAGRVTVSPTTSGAVTDLPRKHRCFIPADRSGSWTRVVCFALACWVWQSSTAQESPLPPVTTSPEESEQLSTAARVFAREYQFVGNTVFSDEELAWVVADYANRKISSAELEEARRALTTYYVERGYINSGAVLEDQPIRDGVIVFRIVEGVLSKIDIEGNNRLRDRFLRSRLERFSRPLNLTKLQETIILLDRNPNIDRINAELNPGDQRGTSRLKLSVEEARPYSIGMSVGNQRPPSVGATSVDILAAHRNLLGYSDTLDLRYGLLQETDDGVEFSGLDNLGVSYEIPFTRYDTKIRAAYHRQDYTQIAEPFRELDIESESQAFTLGVTHPVIHRPNQDLTLGLIGERRESHSTLLGEPFSFSPGAVDGRSEISALRFSQEWVHRAPMQVVALRSTFSFGLDVFRITDNGTSRDGEFVKWQGQAQYVRRLDQRGDELILRVGGQWANDPLLALEQIAIGGVRTVRGYRENELVRDTGLLLSAEVRIPVWKRKSGANLVALAPFIDYGRGWNIDTPTQDPPDIGSAGLGVIVTPHDNVYGYLYWGYAFRNLSHADHYALQDNGLHFYLRVMAF